jgi:hypothetical protein
MRTNPEPGRSTMKSGAEGEVSSVTSWQTFHNYQGKQGGEIDTFGAAIHDSRPRGVARATRAREDSAVQGVSATQSPVLAPAGRPPSRPG